MPKAKYTLEGLEALRKERRLTHAEEIALWNFKNPERAKEISKRSYTKNYEKNKEKIKARNDAWVENNRAKYNETKRKYQAKRRAEKKAARLAYLATPEGLAETAAKAAASVFRAREASARWRAENPEKAKEVATKTRLKNREKRLANAAAWRAANPEHVKAYQAAYDDKVRETKCEKRREAYAANPEAARKVRRDWRLANPEQAARNARAAKARRRAAKAAAGGSHTIAETTALFATQLGRCANPYCCIEIDMKTAHLDHIYPLAPQAGKRQGSNGIENLEWLCQPCNQRKSNLDPTEWAKREAKRAGLF